MNTQVIEQNPRDTVSAVALIQAYRSHGHLRANLDPIGFAKKQDDYGLLSLETYGFGEADLDRKIFINNELGRETATLREILEILQETYSSNIGYEFSHILDPERREWFQSRIEGKKVSDVFTADDKKEILQHIVEAQGFEQFLDVKYKGAKRFGVDGTESALTGIQQAIATAAANGVREVVIGIAHRGRLNVLTQVTGKPVRAIIHEFKGGSFKPDDVPGSGDVKYHLGASIDRDYNGNTVHLTLTPNPSHLEVVNPVTLGRVRAKQDLISADARDENGAISLEERAKVMPLLIHGDAAFIGQGVNAETLNLQGLDGYNVAGTLHVVINNQIGFTTDPHDSRSTRYVTDFAKGIEAPVLHVNGDDPEAVAFVFALAAEYRATFHRPVVVDVVGYRKLGHNEGDEPAFTQPTLYKLVRQHKSILDIYGEKLVEEGVVTQEDLDERKAKWRAHLDAEFEAGQNYKPNKADWFEGDWSGLRLPTPDDERYPATGVALETLKEIGGKLTAVPEGFNIHRTIQRFLDDRAKMIESGENINWATAEALAFGSLLLDGHPIRLSGEDAERATFSQRHSVLHEQETNKQFAPLNNLANGQALYEVHNSPLTEYAVLGFDYGYSLSAPNTLTLWEAQFGDFANTAQVIFDQYISSAEVKWLRASGLILLLPHGYEGQGPEHSSARVERYLQAAAEDNLEIANATTPANYFHLLRRQLKREFRKPLVLFTPKSLLRNKRAVSTLADLAEGTKFQPVLRDGAELGDGPIKLQEDAKIRRVIISAGKVHYELLEEREKREIDDIYLLRLEQFYPFPAEELAAELSRFPNAEIVWTQEEPKNMGGWSFVTPYIEQVLSSIGASQSRPRYAGRAAAASTAAGLGSLHKAQIEAFLEEALGS